MIPDHVEYLWEWSHREISKDLQEGDEKYSKDLSRIVKDWGFVSWLQANMVNYHNLINAGEDTRLLD